MSTRPCSPAALSPTFRGLPGAADRTSRGVAVALIAAAHLAVLWGWVQMTQVREAARERAPMRVRIIARHETIASPESLPALPALPPLLLPPLLLPPAPKKPTAPVVLVATQPRPLPLALPLALPATAPEPMAEAPDPPAAVAMDPAPPAPVATEARVTRVIPNSALQYLEAPEPAYPPLSRRDAESGRVLVLVFIDETGRPSQVQVARSSGYPRLDLAAVASVQRARFLPPKQDGRPVTGWAHVPIDFGLEK